MTAKHALRATTIVAGLAASEAALWACPVCFQMPDGPVPAGARAAVFVLISATVVVLAACGSFVVRFVRRERQLARLTSPEPHA